MKKLTEEQNKLIRTILSNLDADAYILSGEINEESTDKLIEATKKPKKKKGILIPSTWGGCPDCAFRIARRMQMQYEQFILYVPRFCKSAGTLIALGADEIIMGELGELGPLDSQIREKDEFFVYTSSLDIEESIEEIVRKSDYILFERINKLTSKGFTTKISLDLALKTSNNFMQSALSQLDLSRIGEISRARELGIAYGERLIESKKNVKREGLDTLAAGYPNHGFVIDFIEAKKLFNNIRKENEMELGLIEPFYELLKLPEEEVYVQKLGEERENVQNESENVHTRKTKEKERSDS